MPNRIKVTFDLDEDQKIGMIELSKKSGISFAECCRQAISVYLAYNKIKLKKVSDSKQVSIKECENESTIENRGR